jgi:hypothetical protein
MVEDKINSVTVNVLPKKSYFFCLISFSMLVLARKPTLGLPIEKLMLKKLFASAQSESLARNTSVTKNVT